MKRRDAISTIASLCFVPIIKNSSYGHEINPSNILDYFIHIQTEDPNRSCYRHFLSIDTEIWCPYVEYSLHDLDKVINNDVLHILAAAASDSGLISTKEPECGEIFFHDDTLQIYIEKYFNIKVSGKLYIIMQPSEDFIFVTPIWGKTWKKYSVYHSILVLNNKKIRLYHEA